MNNTEQPAHVPDIHVGDIPKEIIPTDIMLFIINESHKAVHEQDAHNFPQDVGKAVGKAMYHKMQERLINHELADIESYKLTIDMQQDTIATLTQERDDYRAVLEEIEAGTLMGDPAVVPEAVLKKYASPGKAVSQPEKEQLPIDLPDPTGEIAVLRKILLHPNAPHSDDLPELVEILRAYANSRNTLAVQQADDYRESYKLSRRRMKELQRVVKDFRASLQFIKDSSDSLRIEYQEADEALTKHPE